MSELDESEHVYRVIQVVGSSPEGIDEAIRNAVGRASRKLRNLRWFEVADTRGQIKDGKVVHFQVTLKIGFKMD